MTKEQKFFKALEDIFIGAKIEGDIDKSGYINLMKIKSRYYEKAVFPELKKDIDESLKHFPEFREELFDKLYSFFNRYFSESGSIYFRYTPLHQNVYEKVYTDDKDVMLFWKTHMLYYVKTDRIFKNLEVGTDGYKFFFDVSNLEYKKANEKRDIIYEFKEKRKDGVIVFNVYYSERGRKTPINDISRDLKIDEGILDKAFRIFEKQNEVDYFINKNAKEFLREQFNLWMYQYIFTGESEWTDKRIKQLQVLKDIAFKIIDFISQFENELVKIWNKPKFVLNSNYVITLDRIADKDEEFKLIEKILNHKNINEQIDEWKELGMLDDNFDKNDIYEITALGKQLNSKYQHLPIDTKYFKDLELQLLSLFDDLDNSLDGWLIKSENYQALNTILPKFKEKVQTIYIDPPFNTGNDFIYLDKFQDSTWISLLDNRIKISKDFLNNKGNFYLHLDHIAEHYGKILLDNIFGKENFKAKITWNTGENISGFKSQADNWIRQADFIHYYTKTDQNIFQKAYEIINHDTNDIGWLDILSENKNEFYIEKWVNGEFIKEKVNYDVKAKGTIWNDIYSFQYSEPRITESLSFVSNQKPENLLRRIIQTSSYPRQLIMDFFVGCGTTCAVAQKINRRWLGIEMGDYFYEIYVDEDEIDKQVENNYTIVKVLSESKTSKCVLIKKIGLLGRMKIVLNGDKEFKAIHSQVIRRPHLTKDVNWQGGGFFKYYEFEQYEDTLRKVRYEESDIFENIDKDLYNQYVFLRDPKMLEALEIDYDDNKVKVDLSKLYQNIDIPETLSNLRGKWIKKITSDFVEFEDGERINIKDLDYKIIKPLIWW